MTDDSSQYLVSEFEAKRIIQAKIEVYQSEYRDKNAKGKIYAYIQEYDEFGNRGNSYNTDDYDSIEELKRGIKKELQEYGVIIKF